MDFSAITSFIAGTDPTTLLTFAGLGGIASVVTQFIKHWLSLQKERVIVILTVIITFLAVVTQYFLFASNTNPNLIGQHTAIAGFVGTLVYYFIVKPFYTTLQNAKAYKTSIAANNITDAGDKLIEAAPVIEPAVEQAIKNAPSTVSSVKTKVETTSTQIKSDLTPVEFAG